MAPTVTQPADGHDDPGIVDQSSSTSGADLVENAPGTPNPMNYIGEGATPLMYACQQAREKEVKSVLAKKPPAVRERDRTSKTPLHYCAENTELGCADMVLEAAPDLLDARDEDGYTALHLAVIAGNRQLIKMLLAKRADVNSLDNERHSVVHWATVCGEVEALELVLDAGAKASTPDIHGGYPIHYAAQMCGPNSEMGNDVRFGLAVLRKLLARGVEVNVTDRDGRQPILWAASAGSADAILALVNAGANVEADDKDGLTALHCAASRGHTDCLETLVTLCGAEIDVIDSNGCTALFYSVTLGHADSTQLLLGFGAEPNRQDRKGRTPAHCGAAKGQLETLRILATHGANLWVRNVKGDYPLHEAVVSGRKELVRWLLTQRPDAINSPNNDGRCPLHIAAVNNNVEMCKIVLDSQALVNPVMRTGKGQLMTPLDAALHRGNRGCAKYLQLHGGVPASKLTDQAAKLTGGSRRVAMSETHSDHNFPTPDLGYSLAPGGGTSILSISPIPDHALMMAEGVANRIRKGDSRALQVRLNDDVAIRHVERIEAPIICRHHCFVDDSSEDELRRRRRRRRMRERRADSSKYSDSEQELRRRRRRREQYSDSDSRDTSVRRRRRRKAKTEDEGSDRESDRDMRRKWTGRSRVEDLDSEGIEDDENGNKRRPKKYRVTKGKKGKRRIQSDKDDESEDDVHSGKPRRSKSKSKTSIRNVKETEDYETEDSDESSDGEIGDRIRVSKLEQKEKTNKKSVKSRTQATSETPVTKKREGKIEKEVHSKYSDIKSETPGKSVVVKKEGTSRNKIELRKTPGRKDRVDKSEEKFRGRRINKSNEVSKENANTQNVSPMKTQRKFVKRSSDGKVMKSAILAVEEIVVNDGEEVVKRKYERQLGNQQISDDDDHETTEKSQRIVTALVHHADGSVSGESRDVGESENNASIQESEIPIEEYVDSEAQKLSVEQTEEDVSAKTSRPASGKESETTAHEEVDALEGSLDVTAMSVHEENSPEGEDVEDESPQGDSEPTETADSEMNEHAGDNATENNGSRPEENKPREEEKEEDSKLVEDSVKEAFENEPDDYKLSKDEVEDENPSDETDGGTVLDENENQSFRDGEGAMMETGALNEAAVELEMESAGLLLELDAEAAVESERKSAGGSLLELDAEAAVESERKSAGGLLLELDAEAAVESERKSPGGLESTLLELDERVAGESERKSPGGSQSTLLELDGASEPDDAKATFNRSASAIEHDESRSGASTARSQSRSRSQNGDSSLHLDSGFEPSPRRGKSAKRSAGVGRRKGRIPRLCRTDDEDRPAISSVSVTQAVQNSMRKYQLERRIFQELLELKRLQIRSGRANEQLLVKRLVDDYRKAGLIVGLRQYDGIYTYRNFEKYLYDQLRLLQTTERKLIPRVKSSDDLDKLTKALKNARLSPLADEVPDNPIFCTHSTHRCHHAAHAYTGVPCAAYITKANHHLMPKGNHIAASRGFLPRIDPRAGRVTGVSRPLRYVDPSRPVTLELSHGAEKQVISLPTERLDKNKRYYVTFTIKGGSGKEKNLADTKDEEGARQRHAKSF